MQRPLHPTGDITLDWANMSSTCDPFRVAPRMADTPRGQRKRETVEAFAWLLEHVMLPRCDESRRRLTIVDAGCSTGSLILPLAFAFPDANFVGVDLKPNSLALLNERAAAAGLSNRVSTWEGRIEDYNGPCDALVSLHACGGASDAALQLAARRAPAGRRAAPFAVSPCCVGALPVGVAPGGRFGSASRGAASAWLSSHLTRAAAAESGDGCGGGGTDLFALLTKSADAHWTSEAVGGPGGAAAARQQRAKRVIEIDRLASMPGDGLGGRLMRLSGAAMAATSSLAEVLVGPPEVFG